LHDVGIHDTATGVFVMKDVGGPVIRKGSLRYRIVAGAGLLLIRLFEASVRRVTPARAFYAPHEFPWVAKIESEWPAVRDELRTLLAASSIPAFERISEEQARLVAPDTWCAFLLYTFGHKVAANCARCPRTAALLESIPGMTLGMFSVLAPRSRIAAHRGVYNGVLRYHLALTVPSERERCGIRIAGAVRHWTEGQSLIFDDTCEHEVWNDTDEQRVVLFVDFLRELPQPLDWLNRGMLRLIGASPYVQNMLVNLGRLEDPT
jgi:beta-hydroxylase